MKKIVSVEALPNYQVKLRFDDGVEGIADLSHLVGKGVFAAWNDKSFFAQAQVGADGELMWPGEIDLCPDALYLRVTGKRVEELFPGLKTGAVNA